MGSSVGQVPEYTEMITAWAKEAAKTPVIVKLTPNVTDVTRVALAAQKGGADAVSLINTVNSLMGVDLETFSRRPNVGGKSSHGGYCGPAVKPIALHMVSSVAKAVRFRSPESEAWDFGTTPRSTSRWARPWCKSARRRCTTAFASWKT